MPKRQQSSGKLFRTSLTLPKDLDGFLHEVGLELRDNNGYRLAKTEVVRALIKAFQKMYASGKLDLDTVRSEEDLVKRLLKAQK